MTETLSTSKEIPKTRLALEEKYKNEPKEPHAKRLDPDNIKDVVDQLPTPVGYRLLVLPFTPKEKTKGGILFSQEQLDKVHLGHNHNLRRNRTYLDEPNQKVQQYLS